MNNSHKIRVHKIEIVIILLVALCALFLFRSPNSAQTSVSERNKDTIVVGDSTGGEVFSYGKNVIVKGKSKGVLAVGGDITVEGEVTGDVATIGGTVYHKSSGYIGGDVIIFGGRYRHESMKPRRNLQKHTLMYSGYEVEFRSIAKDPAQLLTPKFTPAFLSQRVFSLLFWFVISFVITLIAPASIGGAVTRLRLMPFRILAFGVLGFLIAFALAVVGIEYFSGGISAALGLMLFVSVALAYIFGRVAIQVGIGKWIVSKFIGESKFSDAITLFIGTITVVATLSLPYLWLPFLILIFVMSLGVLLTLKSGVSWRNE
ncbi:MAG: hypothetical protein ACK5NT_00090 [Pyrinomonadaceae bacterium]